MFVNAAGRDFTLQPGSPCINTGNPSSVYNDRNGTRNDRGYTGGPYAATVGDIDDNGCVNLLDLLSMRPHLGKSASSGGIAHMDLNRDGVINLLDLLKVRSNMNAGCGKPQWP